MPFNGDLFTRLGLPPYSGALAAEFQNLADGLTALNTSTNSAGFTLHSGATAPDAATGVDGDWYLNTTDGSWYDKAGDVWTNRYTDQLGAAGTTDGVASGISFTKATNTVTATVTRTQGLDALTGAFDVFSGVYGDLTSKPTLFSGSWNDLADKPTIAKSIFLVSNLPPAASAVRSQLYGLVTVPNVSDPASSLHYLKKETVGTFRIRFDDVSSRSSSANFTAYGYASIDAPSGGYYGMGVLDGISPVQARTNGVIALVRTRTRSGANLTRYRVLLSDALRDGETTIWLAMRPESSTDTPVTLEMTYDATDGDFASNNLANDPFGSIPHSVWEVQLATQQDLALLSILPTVTEDHLSQLVDDVILHSTISDVNQHIQQLIDAIDLSVYVLNTSNRLIPGGQMDDQILRATGDMPGEWAWEALPPPTPVPDLTPYALKTTIENRLVPASGTDNFILRRTGSGAGDFAWESETAAYTDANAVAAVAAADPYVLNTGDNMTGGLTVIPATNQVALFLDATALTTATPFVFNMNASGNQQAIYLRRGSSGQAWMTVDGNIGGGDENPGIAMGLGGLLTPDVTLFRGGDGILRTNSVFESPSLQFTTDATDLQVAASRDSLLGAGGADGQILTREVVMADPPSLRWGLWVVPANMAGDLETPNAAMAGMAIGVKDDGLYHVEPVPHHAILPTGTWGSVPTSYPWHDADGNAVKNFYHGAFPNHSHSGFSNDNEFFLDYSNRHFYHSEAIVPGGQSRRIIQRADPTDWIGFGTRTELLARATAVGQWGYDTDEVGNTAVIYLTAFMAGVPAITDYQWRFSSVAAASLEIQKDGTQDYLGAPVINFAGSGVVVSGNTVTVASPPTTGITQNAADDRYVLETGDTMTGPLIVGRVDGGGSTLHVVGAHGRTTPTTPGIIDITGPQDSVATQTAFTIRRHNDTVDYFHVTGDVGGTSDSRPGFLLGVGGTTIHDTNLYRSDVDTLKTDDAFIADTLAVSGTLATTQTNLGISRIGQVGTTDQHLRVDLYQAIKLMMQGGGIVYNDTGFQFGFPTPVVDTNSFVNAATLALTSSGKLQLTLAGTGGFSNVASNELTIPTGGGGGDDTLAVLLGALNGDGTNDLPVINPVGGTNQDYLLIYDKSGNILARTGVGDLAAILPTSVSANPTLVSTDGTLTSLHIGGMNWRIPAAAAGTTVVANPGGSSLADLDTITIGTDSYAIAGAAAAPLSVPPETLYENTSDVVYTSGSWHNLSGFRALAEGDDTKLIEVRCQVFTSTFTDYDFFYFPVETFRGMSFNTSSTASADNAVRFKTLRNDTAVSSGSHSGFYVSRNNATTWRIGQAHQLYKRFRFRLLAVNGVAGEQGIPGPAGAGLVVNPSNVNVTTPVINAVGIGGTNYRIAAGTIAVLSGYNPPLPASSQIFSFANDDFDLQKAGQTAAISLATGIVPIFANPSGTATLTLTGLQIGPTLFNLPGAAGGLSQTEVDARINVLVPTADIHARLATSTDAASWNDRHSWTAQDIQTTVQSSMVDAISPGILYYNSVPPGGTTGQLLAKTSNNDRRTQWIDAPTGGGGGTVDAAAIIAAVSGSPSATNDVINWGTGGTLSWAAGGGSTTVAGLDTEEIGSANIALTTTNLTATGFILPVATDNPWLLVNIGSIGNAIPEDARWFMVNTAQLLGKNGTAGNAPGGANSVFVELGVDAGFSRQFMYFSTIQSTRELLVAASSASLDPTPLSVHKIVPGSGGGGTTFDINALTAFGATDTVDINNDLWALYDSSESAHRKMTSVQAVRAMFRANTVNMNPDSIADADHIQFYDHTDGGVARALTWASARDKLITDADLNATAANEATNVAPSRQVVAELRDALTVGSLNILGLTNNTGGNVEATADYFAMYSSDPVSGSAGNRRVNTFHAYEGMMRSTPAASDFQFGDNYMFMGAYINASGTHPTHVLYSDLQAKVLSAIPTGTTPRTDEAIRDVSYAGMQGGYGITVDVQDSENKVFISAESSADSQFVIAMIEPNGDIWAVNRVQPSESFLLVSTGISNVQGVARDGDKFYFCTSARQVLEYDAIAGTTASQGTLPSSHGSVCHAFFAANNTFYAITEDAGDNYFWSIGDLTNPSGASGVGAVTPFTVNFIAGIEFNGRILISSSGGRIYEWAPGASSATQVHDQVAPGKATTRPLIVFGGSLYASVNSSSGTTDFYFVDLDTPANTRLVGAFPSGFNRPTGGGILLAPLSTSFVEEGTNLYHTNARVDARIETWARAGASSTPDPDRLGTGGATDKILSWGNGTVATWIDQPSGGGGFSGSYADLTNKPTLGTAAALNTGSSSGNIPVLNTSGLLNDDELTANIPRKNLSNTFTNTIIIEPPDDSVCLFLKAENLTTQTPFVFNISASGNQQAMWLRRGSTGQAWMTVDGNAGGNNEMPGIFFGDGVATRDVVLHRRAADVLKTPDTMDVGALQIAGVDLDIDVGFLSATALHLEHLDALTADLEVETEKTHVRVTAIANGGLHNSSGSTEPTFTTAQTFTYAVEHTFGILSGTASNFWKWVSIRIPETIDIGGTLYDSNFVDYRIRNASTQSDGREYYSLGNIEELGVAGGWRYGKLRSRIYANSVQHIEVDVLQIRGTEFHGDIPDAAQITGGTLPAGRYSSSATIRSNLGLGSAATVDTGAASGKIATLGSGGRLVKDRLPGDTLYAVNHDNTLIGDGSSSTPLGVSVQEIITELTERIRYYANSPYNVSSRGSTAGHRYTTSPHAKTVYRVGIRIDPPTGDKRYKARILAISSSDQISSVLGSSEQRTATSGVNWFNFQDGGTLIPASQRVAIVLSRTHAGNNQSANIEWGSEASASPYESYDDASNDFDDQGDVEYSKAEPESGDSTEHTGTGSIQGNIDIRYRITYDHGSLIGDGIAASQVTSGRFNIDRLAWSGSQADYDALTPDANTLYLITS